MIKVHFVVVRAIFGTRSEERESHHRHLADTAFLDFFKGAARSALFILKWDIVPFIVI